MFSIFNYAPLYQRNKALTWILPRSNKALLFTDLLHEIQEKNGKIFLKINNIGIKFSFIGWFISLNYGNASDFWLLTFIKPDDNFENISDRMQLSWPAGLYLNSQK